ncbi:HK97 family phage prohead protease [Thioclava sp. GXIMD4215]|uniref:HK97 family phage prohead protease n=1 Tax=Thioclava sp. GXIMD4215 TaxID=3131928 RepID=UPI003254CFA4
MEQMTLGLEFKSVRTDTPSTLKVTEDRIEGYASLFGLPDQGGDVVCPGAYTDCLARLAQEGRRVAMLWQHDQTQPIGVWEDIHEDRTGLFVRGYLLEDVTRAREARALLASGAMDGLSIGYRVVRAHRDGQGQRMLTELDLWEVSLVTFPMLKEARVAAKAMSEGAELSHLARALRAAASQLAGN